MKHFFSVILVLLAVLFSSAPLHAAEQIQSGALVGHDLKVVLHPNEHRFTAEDTITVPGGRSGVRFLLHKGLGPSSPTPGVSIAREAEQSGPVPLEYFRVKLPAGSLSFVLRYGGTVNHPLDTGKEQARGFSQTPGVISDEGVFLAGSSFWYPVFEEGLLHFTLRVELPSGWNAVSQGERTVFENKKGPAVVRWESPEPQDEIYLIAARFNEYTRPGKVQAMAFLRTPDKGLAEKYLDATARYISLYDKLIGPYPYKKFALVENFWETGLGMPSFTLLGPKVIRLPFIINSSYPHEILHNWWGNSVFPDYPKGNWSEGLTAYLSDHLMKEQQGEGPEYRRATLQKYTDYVSSVRDFPLTGFRSRHGSSSEAVGYGKSLMLFHMLRREMGDKAFVAALQDFYGRNKFKVASFDDLRLSFEKASGKKLKKAFDQWVKLPGAPKLRLGSVRTRTDGSGYTLTAVLEQTQPGKAYLLQTPVAVTMEGRGQAYQATITLDKKRTGLKLHVPARPLRLDIDPGFDLFRRLDLDEIPPAVSQALGAQKMLILLPSSADKDLLEAYRGFAEVLGNSGPDAVEIKLDSEIKKLPSDRAVTVLGWENRFAGEASSLLANYGAEIGRRSVRIRKTEIPKEGHVLVLTARNPGNREMAVTLIASGRADALPGLGRKLPHYHKYSYLAFEGSEPENTAKGRWPLFDSPMTAFVPGSDGRTTKTDIGRLAPEKPLAALPAVYSSLQMMETVRFLASEDLKGRGFGTEELDRAAEYIAQKFREAGLRPAGDTADSYFQTWKESGGEPEHTAALKNVVGVIPGKDAELSGQSIVIGAHYDHLGLGWPDAAKGNKGKIHPGADDNASGVAVLIELARVLGKGPQPDRSIVFAAFSGEESGKRGSRHYITHQKRYPPEKCIGMVNLDTVGRLEKKKLLVLGTGTAREWAHIFRGAGFVTGVETDMVAERLDSSDQVSFEEAGVPAVQLFTGPHPDYHRPTDTADKIDPDGLVKVASVAAEVIEYLAHRFEPMTVQIKAGGSAVQTEQRARKVSMGTVPDFVFAGKGCRISGVVPGSPAEACGLREGDIITKINSREIGGLKDLSDVLKTLIPGSRIVITFLRNGMEMTAEAEVVEK